MNFKLQLSYIQKMEALFYGYADAKWAEDRNDRKSNIFKVIGAVVRWRCRKQSCDALSSTCCSFRKLPRSSFTLILVDNQSCLKLLEEETLSNRSKHIGTRYHFVKEYIAIAVCMYCPTEAMLADFCYQTITSDKTQESYRTW